MANKKVRPYRKPLNLNIGIFIFAFILLYAVYLMFAYFKTEHIVRYEVVEGSLAANNTYRAVVLRTEAVVVADQSGYVNYYAREGERVARGDLVYTLDETGQLNASQEEIDMGENTLSERDLAEFRSEIVNFVHGYEETNFSTVYDFKYSLKNTVLKISNANLLANIDSLAGGISSVKMVKSPMTGIVAYWYDGYETLRPEQINAAIFEERNENYEKTQLTGAGALTASGAPVFKLSTDENWSVAIPIEAERGAELVEEEYIKVRFLKNQYESWGKVSMFTGSDGKTYLKLDFNNSMMTFISDRFLDIELILYDETGLKIPNSAIVEKEFFLIPEDFVMDSNLSNEQKCILRQTYKEDGSTSSERVDTYVYNYDKETGEYYLDASKIEAGDILLKPNSQDTFVVSRRGSLIGVYNMNKGYADFKQISILYQNEEYAIVEANSRYGLAAYDYIVLNAADVDNEQFLYQ